MTKAQFLKRYKYLFMDLDGFNQESYEEFVEDVKKITTTQEQEDFEKENQGEGF